MDTFAAGRRAAACRRPAKWLQFEAAVFAETGLAGSRWFQAGLVELELVLGLWFLSGAWPRLARPIALTCFTVLAAVSLAKALAGQESCGCFGAMNVSPWITLAVDLAVIATLASLYPPLLQIHMLPG